MNIIYAKSDSLVVGMLLKALNELAMAPGCLYRDDVRVKRQNGINNIMEFTVAHMSMDLCRIPNV
ncbi:hypothetical protein D3C77_799460 [compost metagenome]